MKQGSKKWLLGLPVLLLVAGLGWLLVNRGALARPEVALAKVARGDLAPAVYGIGTVEARLAYAVGPTQPGRVRAVLADQGDRVGVGQALGELDPVDLDERIAGASQAVERAGFSVTVAEAQLQEAASRQALAHKTAARYRELETKRFVSREMADARQSEAEVARSALAAAQAALEAARRDAARASADRAALAQQRANLKLLSPVDGVVVSREAEPGTSVVAGQAVLRLIDPRSLWVRVRVDQARSRDIAPGQSAEIVLRSRQGEILPGRVARVEIQADSVTEERVVHVSFNQLPAGPALGELAEVTIMRPAIKGVLLVPSAAVKRENGRDGVWRIDAGKARFAPVEAGVQTLDGKTQIVGGLREGEQVIVHSPVDIEEGLKVRAGKSG